MTPFTERLDVPVAGGTLRVGVAGPPGAPPVLAVHGITANHLSWAAVARSLGGRARLIAPDLRGRGRSASLPEPYGMKAHAEDLAAVLDHMGIERAVAAGHSMGAFVVATLATTAPERVSEVVLVDGGLPIPAPPGLDPDAVLDAVLGPAIARLRQEFASVDDYLTFWRAHPAFAPTGAWNDDVEAYVRYDLTGEPPTLRSCVSEAAVRFDGTELVVDESVRHVAEGVAAPTRVLRAPRGLFDEEGGLVPVAEAATFARRHPNVTLETVEGANHYTILLADPGVSAVTGALLGAAGR